MVESNAKTFLSIWHHCMSEGVNISPRGLEILEIEDFQFEFSPINPFMTFQDRNYDVSYFKKEMMWKLGANKYDQSIKQHAKMWESVQNPDGTFNSNYGQYWFGEQNGFWNVVNELIRDRDSRQAVIPMLSKEHMSPQTVDKVCTFGVGFRIRDGKLNMSVQMRSSDQVFGLGTDIPTFSFLYRLVYLAVSEFHRDILIGIITITAMSSHIYSRHFDMVRRVLDRGMSGYIETDMPWPIDMSEVLYLLASKGKIQSPHPKYALSNWMREGVVEGKTYAAV